MRPNLFICLDKTSSFLFLDPNPALERMQDPLDTYQQTFTCPFCQIKFSDVVKLIHDCGSFICGTCSDELNESLGRSKRYKCDACGDHHILPENRLPACKKLANFLRHPIEKPLSDQAKKLKPLIEDIQKELANLQTFNPRDYIEKTRVELENDVSQAAESLVKHIRQIEANLHIQIRAYCQGRLDKISNNQIAIYQLDASTQTFTEFCAKWNDYFKRLNSFASEDQIKDAIDQA